MKKGMAVNTAAKLFLYAMVFLLIAVLFFFYVPGLLEELSKLWSYTSPFEQAVRCSFYRCVEGCDSDKVGRISWSGIECTDFCNPKWYTDEDKKTICGWEAIQYPVEVHTSGDQRYHSKTIGGIDFDCVTPLDTPQWKDGWELLKTTGVVTGATTICLGALMMAGAPGLIVCPIMVPVVVLLSPKYDMLVLDPDLIHTREEEKCTPGLGQDTYDSVEKFSLLQDKTAYIFTDRKVGEIFGFVYEDVKTVTALTIPTYVSIKNKDEKQTLQVVEDLRYRFRIVPQDRDYVFEVDDIDDESTPSITFRIDDNEPETLDNTNQHYHLATEGGYIHIEFAYVEDSRAFLEIEYASTMEVPTEGALLFTDSDFGTPEMLIPEDEDNLQDKGFDNKASSIKLPSGWKAILYENSGFGGTSISIAGDSSHLSFGDKASSIKITGGSDCYVTVYKDKEYGGGSITISEDISDFKDISGLCGGYNTVCVTGVSCDCNCDAFGTWCKSCPNNCISSIKVKEGCVATLYQSVDFEGDYITLFGDSSNLHFDNIASSIKLVPPEGCTDSDGTDKTIKGTCTSGGFSGTDTCIDSTNICELVCGTGGCACMFDTSCPPDTTCFDGACIEEPPGGTCASVGGICDRPVDCTDGYDCYCYDCLDCTEYPATCCCAPS